MRGMQGTCAITPRERRSLEIPPRWSRYCSPAPGRGRAGPAAAQGTESRSDGVGWLCRFPPAHGGCCGRLVEPKRCDLSPRRCWAARGWGLSAPRIQTPMHGVNLANQPGGRSGRGRAPGPADPCRPTALRPVWWAQDRLQRAPPRRAHPGGLRAPRPGRAGPSHAVQILGAGPGHAVWIVGAELCRAARGSPGSGAGAAGPGAERGAGRGDSPGSDTPLPFLGPLAALAPPPRRPAGPAEPRRAGAAGKGAAGHPGGPRGTPRSAPLPCRWRGGERCGTAPRPPSRGWASRPTTGTPSVCGATARHLDGPRLSRRRWGLPLPSGTAPGTGRVGWDLVRQVLPCLHCPDTPVLFPQPRAHLPCGQCHGH